MPTPLTLVKGIGPATAEKLASAGLKSAEEIAAATPEQLLAVPGFGPSRADQVIADARQLVAAAKSGDDDMTVASETAGPEKKKAPKKKTKPKGKVKKKTGKEKKAEKKQGKKDKQKKEKKQAAKDKERSRMKKKTKKTKKKKK